MVNQQNPHLDKEGYPLPGQSEQARAFAAMQNRQYLDSLPADERARVEARQRNAQAHQNS